MGWIIRYDDPFVSQDRLRMFVGRTIAFFQQFFDVHLVIYEGEDDPGYPSAKTRSHHGKSKGCYEHDGCPFEISSKESREETKEKGCPAESDFDFFYNVCVVDELYSQC